MTTRTPKPRHGICERFPKTILQEFYQPELLRNLQTTLDELQSDLEGKICKLNLT
jgi:hypothetical protein